MRPQRKSLRNKITVKMVKMKKKTIKNILKVTFYQNLKMKNYRKLLQIISKIKDLQDLKF